MIATRFRGKPRPPSHRGPVLRAAVVGALTLAASACGGNGRQPTQSSDPVPNLDAGAALSWQPRHAIRQTVRLLNPGLRQGDTLRLESRLRNVSDAPVSIEHVVCALDIEGELVTEPPYIHCVAYSVRSTLAPGEEVSSLLERVVASGPGRYTITIRHLLDPAVWVPVELTIRP